MGKRWFLAGLWIMLLFALGHLVGFLHACYVARNDPSMTELTEAMRSHRARLLGFEPSILDFREYFSLNFSLLMASSAVLGFQSLRVSADKATIVHRLSRVYLVTMLGLIGTSIFFSVPQGIINATTVALLFAVAVVRSRPGKRTSLEIDSMAAGTK